MRTRLPMPAGLRIELAKKAGLSHEELFRALKEKDEAVLKAAGENLDWDYMFSLTEKHEEEIQSAINEGYVFKFLTINGLKNYLRIRFHLNETADYEATEHGINRLTLSEENAQELRSTLSGQWELEAVGSEYRVKNKHM